MTGCADRTAWVATDGRCRNFRQPAVGHQRTPNTAVCNVGPVTPAELSTAILAAVGRAVDAGELTVPVPSRAVVERPKNRAHGDYASNGAAGEAGRPAAAGSGGAGGEPSTRRGRGRGGGRGRPGVPQRPAASGRLGELARTVVAEGPAYGHTTENAGQRLNLELIGGNPPGPLHLGHVRWAAVGDALGRLLTATGAEVTREYYFNDSGVQIDRFAALYAAARGLPTPDDGYVGEYAGEVAQQVVAADPEVLGRREDEALEVFRREGLERMFASIKSALAEFGVVFDVYFLERSCARLRRRRRGDRAAAGRGPRLGGGRRAVDAQQRVRRCQGPGAGQVRTGPRRISPGMRRTT